jgi:nicotinamidase-related amidase
MPLIATTPTALVLVDYQQRLLPAIHQAESVLAQATLLADIGRTLGWPVIATEQNPRGLGPNAEAIASRCDVTLAKMHFDACADGLVELVQQRGRLVQTALAGDSSAATPDQGATSNPAPIREVVISGCEAHVCLMQTTLGLIDAGFKVWVVAPACGSRSAANHALGMARLQQAGATLVSVEMVAFEAIRSCEHERFKAVLALLKAAG